MTTPTERMLAALTDHNCDPKKNARGWSARCPAHDDRRSSLSVSQGDDARVVVQCVAGCTFDAICGALRVQQADLMPATDTDGFSRQVETCKWFLRQLDRTKRPSRRYDCHSYHLKHCVDQWAYTYTSNESLIEAARQLCIPLMRQHDESANYYLAVAAKSVRTVMKGLESQPGGTGGDL